MCASLFSFKDLGKVFPEYSLLPNLLRRCQVPRQPMPDHAVGKSQRSETKDEEKDRRRTAGVLLPKQPKLSLLKAPRDAEGNDGEKKRGKESVLVQPLRSLCCAEGKDTL